MDFSSEGESLDDDGESATASSRDKDTNTSNNLFAPYQKNSFWADMEPYFQPFTDQDVKFCQQQVSILARYIQ